MLRKIAASICGEIVGLIERGKGKDVPLKRSILSGGVSPVKSLYNVAPRAYISLRASVLP